MGCTSTSFWGVNVNNLRNKHGTNTINSLENKHGTNTINNYDFLAVKTLIEVQTGNYLEEDDIYRFEDSIFHIYRKFYASNIFLD